METDKEREKKEIGTTQENSHEVFKIHFVKLDAHWTSITACSKPNSAPS